MSDNPSDALVFFGATGDLAYKQIFPSLLGLIRDEGLNVPIIGVAKAGWNLDKLKERAKDSIEHHGGGAPEIVDKLFAQLRKELGGAQRPLHYLAVPPSLFGVVAEGLAKEGATTNCRLVIEKPFGHNRVTAKELNAVLTKFFPSERI